MSPLRVTIHIRICALLTIQVISLLGGTSRAQVGWGDDNYNPDSYSDWGRIPETYGWSSNSAARADWNSGINGDNSDVGVIVRQVSPNSAAFRAGISPGDVIICVDRRQVGRVGNQIYDLTEELNRYADSGGRVRLLIQERRTAQLRMVQLQLDRNTGGLSGMLLIRDGRLPGDAVVTVRLENVTRPHYVVRNGQYSFRVTSFNRGQIPFQLNFDPRYISSGDTYRVRAFVTSLGRTIYDTPQPQYVLTQGAPSTVRLYLEPASFGPYTADVGIGDGNIVAAGYSPMDGYGQQITDAYQRYLGRSPTSIELAAWYQTPDVAYQLTRLPLELMAAQEFFDRTGNNRAAWMQRVFAEIIGRAPSAGEMDLWMRRFADLRFSRTELLNQLNMQAGR